MRLIKNGPIIQQQYGATCFSLDNRHKVLSLPIREAPQHRLQFYIWILLVSQRKRGRHRPILLACHRVQSFGVRVDHNSSFSHLQRHTSFEKFFTCP